MAIYVNCDGMQCRETQSTVTFYYVCQFHCSLSTRTKKPTVYTLTLWPVYACKHFLLESNCSCSDYSLVRRPARGRSRVRRGSSSCRSIRSFAGEAGGRAGAVQYSTARLTAVARPTSLLFTYEREAKTNLQMLSIQSRATRLLKESCRATRGAQPPAVRSGRIMDGETPNGWMD